MNDPEVVLFDLDDTLFEHREAVARGIVRHLASAGRPVVGTEAEDAIALWHALEEQHYHSYLAGLLDFPGQRRARARDFAASHGIALTELEAGEWFDAYFEHYRDAWRLHDDALPCLDDLAARYSGVRFGVITNGDLAYQVRKIEDTGLDRRVAHVVASGEVGVAKPDPRIFLDAAARFGVAPSAAVYVGDRLRTDAIGAAAAGLTGVWLDRRNAPVSETDAADAAQLGVIRITDLSALPAALQR